MPVARGSDYYGQATPPAGTDFTAIAAGEDHSLALRSDGSIAGWGYDSWGALSDRPTGCGFTAIAAGRHHALALTPEPATGILCLLGLGFVGFRASRRRKKTHADAVE